MISNPFTVFKRRLILSLSSLLLCFLSGCSTIQFVQHEQPGKHKTVNRWHHSTLNGTVELSAPLNIKSICGAKAWTTITTEFTPYNALAATIFSGAYIVSLHSAWTNKVQCYKPSLEQL
jgi:hypothetical protein